MAGVQIDGVNNKIDFDDDQDTSISANTDDTLVIEAGGNTMATITATTFTINDGTTITTADNTDTLTLTSTDADATVGPNLVLYRNSSSPADSDDIGAIRFDMRNDNSQDFTAFQMTGDCSDVSDGTEDAEIHFDIMTAGTLREYLRMSSGSTPSVIINEDSQDIDFRVESDNDANAFFVQGSDGHVGLGHSAPDVELHLKQTNNHPTIKFENTKTATDSGDFLGHILFHGNDGTSGASGDRAFIKASVDNTSGATSLQLGTSNSGAAVAEALRILGNGNVAIGGTSADSKTDITMPTAGANYAQFLKHSAGSGTVRILRGQFSGQAPDDSTSVFITMGDSSATRFNVNADGDVTNHDNAYGQISDERIKTNITDANSQWADIKAIKVKNFERKDDVTQYGEGKKVQIGVVAQEVETVSPGLIKEGEPTIDDIKMSSAFGTLYEDGDTIPEDKKIGDIKSLTGEKVKKVSYSVLYMKAIKALQEAQTRIETLETKVAALEG